MHLGSTWCKGMGNAQGEWGMERVGDLLLSPAPTRLAGWELLSRLVAPEYFL